MNKKLRTALIASIRKHALPPFTEASLGKLLVDVRRLLEGLNEKEKYPSLTLFCDWVVHSKLSGPKVQKLLAAIDDLYDTRLMHGLPIEDDMPSLLVDFLTFQAFKNELHVLLGKACGVKTPHVLDKNRWEDFEQLYCNIVGDCQLVYESKNKKKPLKPLKHIDSIVVAIVKPQFSPAQLKYDPMTVSRGLEWTLMKNGEEVIRLTITWGGMPALRDALGQPIPPQTPTRPPD